MINAKIICDSVNPVGCRLTTFVLKYNRFIHSELLTHRAFSRNSASSRAIPVSKIISKVREEPALPVYWGINQKGMQASDELSEADIIKAEAIWLESMESQIKYAEKLLALNVHKQIANRLLECYFHMETILTATDFSNFFNLRAHKDAQPEFQELAFCMLEAYEDSKPRELTVGQWHTPFADKYIDKGISVANLLKITTARCARVSYLNFEGDIVYEKDYKLHDDLMASGHWSPFEHAAQCTDTDKYYGNFKGFRQYRKTFVNENRSLFDAGSLRAGRKHYAKKNNMEKMGKSTFIQ